ncbi:MAG TPA: hypothetical protein VIL22_00275 [Paenibacillaceae bacterium]
MAHPVRGFRRLAPDGASRPGFSPVRSGRDTLSGVFVLSGGGVRAITTKVHLFFLENGFAFEISAFCAFKLEKSVRFPGTSPKINAQMSLFRPNTRENGKINALLSLFNHSDARITWSGIDAFGI